MAQSYASRQQKAERDRKAREREENNRKPIPTMAEHLYEQAMDAASDYYRNDEDMMRAGFPLAIAECPHGSLGTDRNIKCLCWDREERVELKRPQIIELTQIAYQEPVNTQFELTTNDGGDAHLKGTNEFGTKLWVLKAGGGYEEIPF
jgi:hypothetical protein